MTVLPIAIVRFRAFRGDHVPIAATVFADVIFSLSGLFNAILYSFTRPSLLPRRNSQSRITNYSNPTGSHQTGGVGPGALIGPRDSMAINHMRALPAPLPANTNNSDQSHESIGHRHGILPDDSDLDFDDWNLSSLRSSRIFQKDGRLTIDFVNPPPPPTPAMTRPSSVV